MDYVLGLVSRWAHILAGMIAVGGTVFARFALLPAATAMPEADRPTFFEAVRKRWSKWVAGAILFLLVSGLYNYFRIIMIYKAAHDKLPPSYHMMFGIKVLIALAMFFLASVIAGRSTLARKFQQDAKLWLSLNLVLAVAIVCLSGVLRSVRDSQPPRDLENQPNPPLKIEFITNPES